MKSVRVVLLPILLAGVVAQVGCVTLPGLKDDSPPKSPTKPPAVSQELPAPPVNPDEVTDANAREKVEALRKELSRENK